MQKCKWCKRSADEIRWDNDDKTQNKIHAILPWNGPLFFACDECLKEHGRGEEYEVPSPYHDLLVSLGV